MIDQLKDFLYSLAQGYTLALDPWPELYRGATENMRLCWMAWRYWVAADAEARSWLLRWTRHGTAESGGGYHSTYLTGMGAAVLASHQRGDLDLREAMRERLGRWGALALNQRCPDGHVRTCGDRALPFDLVADTALDILLRHGPTRNEAWWLRRNNTGAWMTRRLLENHLLPPLTVHSYALPPQPFVLHKLLNRDRIRVGWAALGEWSSHQTARVAVLAPPGGHLVDLHDTARGQFGRTLRVELADGEVVATDLRDGQIILRARIPGPTPTLFFAPEPRTPAEIAPGPLHPLPPSPLPPPSPPTPVNDPPPPVEPPETGMIPRWRIMGLVPNEDLARSLAELVWQAQRWRDGELDGVERLAAAVDGVREAFRQ